MFISKNKAYKDTVAVREGNKIKARQEIGETISSNIQKSIKNGRFEFEMYIAQRLWDCNTEPIIMDVIEELKMQGYTVYYYVPSSNSYNEHKIAIDWSPKED